MVLRGQVDVLVEPDQNIVGKVFAGDVLGEISPVERSLHSETSVVTRDSQFILTI